MSQTWTAEQVWAASATAYRINDGYYKVDQVNDAGQTIKIKNLALVRKALEDVEQIPAEDFELGRLAREHISQRLTLKALKGQLREFDELMTRVIGIEDFTASDRYEIAIVASQIRSYKDSKKDMDWQEQIDRSAGHLAPIGQRIEVDVRLYKAVYSTNYGIYFYQGITPTRQGVWFSNRHRLVEGHDIRVKGTVVQHRDFSTQLNRVKIIKGEIA